MVPPLVSVVLPTYNRRAVLARAMFSVLGQTYHNLELIVVDDGSTDGTESLVGSVRDPRVRYSRAPRQGGAAKARNLGIHAARGDLIAFQDSDDEWLAAKLDLQVSMLLSAGPDVGWVGGSHLVVNGDNVRLVSPKRLIRGKNFELDILDGRAFVTPTWLIRRDSLFRAGLFSERFDNLEDWDLILRLTDICELRAIREPILIKYSSQDSLYGDVGRRAAALELILSEHRARWLRHPRIKAKVYRELAGLHRVQGARADATRCLWASVHLEPWRLGTYPAALASSVGPLFKRRAASVKSPLIGGSAPPRPD
jgi:glycosyltransferase involved in cell wall biosynthesis